MYHRNEIFAISDIGELFRVLQDGLFEEWEQLPLAHPIDNTGGYHMTFDLVVVRA